MTISVQSLNVCRTVSLTCAAVSLSNDDVASSNTTIYTTTHPYYTPTLHPLTLHIRAISRYQCYRGRK